MKKIIFLSLLCTLVITLPAAAQLESRGEDTKFFLDAAAFDAQTPDKSRIDVYVLVPYQSLEFMKSGESYGASYELVVTILDSLGYETEHEIVERKIRESDYFIARGGAGDFDPHQFRFEVDPGEYIVNVELNDVLGDKNFRRSRTVSPIDFDSYDFSISGLLLVSDIESSGEGFVITPHVSDNVGNLEDALFVFFEAYAKEDKNVGFFYGIYGQKDKPLFVSDTTYKDITAPIDREYLKLDIPNTVGQGFYVLKVFAMQSPEDGEEKLIAASQRSVNVMLALHGWALNDLDKAIEQLLYVAARKDIKYIEDAPDAETKQKRFLEFWKERDPSPGTERNEAFDEYYTRILYANQNFTTYTKGWRTDQGMVYVTFGKPSYVETSQQSSGGGVYQRWTYPDNRYFVFYDRTGFGDYRLVEPMAVTELYEYDRY